MNNTSILGYIILSLTIGYVFIYSSLDQVAALKENKTKNEQFLAMVANIQSKKDELLKQFSEIKDIDKNKVNTVLPTSLDFVKLISEIDSVAKSQGILIDRISLTELGSSSGDSVADAAPLKPYKSAVVGFSFVTSYDKFKVFLDTMERSMRILDIRTIKISPNEKSDYTFNVQFETYWLGS